MKDKGFFYGNVEFVTPGMDRYILERTDITELPLPLPPSADPPFPTHYGN